MKKKPKAKAKPRKRKPFVNPTPDPRLKDPKEMARGKPVPLDQSLGIPPGKPIAKWPKNWNQRP